MTEIMTFSTEQVVPDRDAVFQNQGIPAGKVVTEEVQALYVTARDLLSDVAERAGILAEISEPDFEVVYHGEGQNEPTSPVGDIFNRADDLALFAVTLGEHVSREIDERFKANDFALGCMLDSVASAAADKLAEIAQDRFFEILSGKGQIVPATGVLRYSPGYCGWHISGQKKLFEFLRPERIGISLRESFLMQPLKSVSGVMIAGRREIHDFRDSYPFCNQCRTHGCRRRIRALLADQERGNEQGEVT